MDKIFKAMADKNRRIILTCLKKTGEMSVNQLLGYVEIGQSTLSSHLAILKKAKLVDCRVVGKQRIYKINNDVIMGFITELNIFIGDTLVEKDPELKVRRQNVLFGIDYRT